MAFLTDEQIERRAREARRMFKIDEQIIPDVITLVFKLKDLGFIGDYERVPDGEMGTDEAIFDPYNRRLKIRESVFVAANSCSPRARFTIAHEIGHIILGHDRVRHRRADYRHDQAASNVRADERQANIFASALLAPYHLSNLTDTTSISDLASHFQISLQAAEIRLLELQRQYRIANGIKRELPESVRKYLEENKNAGRNWRP